jgi:excisionase family DNA binding protein
MNTDYFTPDEVASRLQVSRQVVYNWINDGRLRAVKAGRTLRIPHYALDAFLEPVHAGDISTGGIEPEGALPHTRFTSSAQAAAEAAGNEVSSRQHLQLEVEHVLLALVRQPDGIVQQVFERLSIAPDQVTQQLELALAKLPADPTFQHSPHQLPISERVTGIIQRAEELATQLPDLQIDTSHFLQAICEETEGVSAQILQSFGITAERLRVALLDLHAKHQAAMPEAAVHRSADWEQRIEQQLTRIETEVAAIRSLLTRPSSDKT